MPQEPFPDQNPTTPRNQLLLQLTMDIKKRWPSPMPSTTLVLLLVVLIAADIRHRAAAQVFCRSQFNLANEACSLRPFSGPNPAQPLQLHTNGSSASYQTQADHHERGHEHGHEHEHDHSHGSSHDHDHEHEHTHSRRHGFGHGGQDPYDTACCRRLMGIDNACICQAMSFLPVFMSKVKHAIKLSPVPGCDVSFECGAVY